MDKIIHYCWLGGKELPEKMKYCIESWKRLCPDYEIKEWNESNYDIEKNDYIKCAYKDKKYAFVADSPVRQKDDRAGNSRAVHHGT